MRIEKINENKIKFVLTENDLAERSINIEELAIPSDKTQKLFKDIMDKALEEYGFESAETPLMVEAMPSSADGIMIIVTRLKDKEDAKERYQSLAEARDLRRFKTKGIKRIECEEDKTDDGEIMVWSFDTLDDIIDLSIRIDASFNGQSSLYKMNGRYFLVLDSSKDLELILGDYGTKHVSNTLSKYYLKEHGETITPANAVKILARSFG